MTLLNLLGRIVEPEAKKLVQKAVPVVQNIYAMKQAEKAKPKFDVATPEMIKSYEKIDPQFARKLQHTADTKHIADAKADKSQQIKAHPKTPPKVQAQRQIRATDYDSLVDEFIKTPEYQAKNLFAKEVSDFLPSSKLKFEYPSMSAMMEQFEKVDAVREDAKVQFEMLSPRKQLDISLNVLEKKMQEAEEAQKEAEWAAIEAEMRREADLPLSSEELKGLYEKLGPSDKAILDKRVENERIVGDHIRGTANYFDKQITEWMDADEELKKSHIGKELLLAPMRVAGGAMRGFASGRTLGTSEVALGALEGEDVEGRYGVNKYSPIPEIAELQKATEVFSGVTYFAGTLVGGAVTYTQVAPHITKLLNKLPWVGAKLAKTPVAAQYFLRNVVESGAETGIRKGTGQEWTATDFALDIVFGNIMEAGMLKFGGVGFREQLGQYKDFAGKLKEGMSKKEIMDIAKKEDLSEEVLQGLDKALTRAEIGKEMPLTPKEVDDVVGEFKIEGKPIKELVEEKNIKIAEKNMSPEVKALNVKKQKEIALAHTAAVGGQLSSRLKGIGMKYAALQRKIEGNPTTIEKNSAKKFLESNYKGKIVEVKGKKGEVVGTAFGKIRVKFNDGAIKSVEMEDIVKVPVNDNDVLKYLKDEAFKDLESGLYGKDFKEAFDKEVVVRKNQTALDTPSEKQLNKYSKEYPDLKLEGVDDMKLIRSKESGEVIGIQNRAGDKRMFETAGDIKTAPEAPKPVKQSDFAMKASGLSKSVEASGIEKGLLDASGYGDEIPKHIVRKQQALSKELSEFVGNNYDEARRISMAGKGAPKGFLEEEVYVATVKYAESIGDVKTLKELATKSALVDTATDYGRRISAFAELSPTVKKIRDVEVMRMKNLVKGQSDSKLTDMLGAKDIEIKDLKKQIEELKKIEGKKVDAEIKNIKMKDFDNNKFLSFLDTVTC